MSTTHICTSEVEAHFTAEQHQGSTIRKSRQKADTWFVDVPDTMPAAIAAAAVDVFEQREQDARTARVSALGGYTKLGAYRQVRRWVEWLIRDFIEAGVIALIVGAKGTYKSVIANHIAMTVADNGLPVFILSPEGSGLQRRLEGWIDEHSPFGDVDNLVHVRDRRLNLSAEEEISLLVTWLDEIERDTGKPIALIVIDTWSKSTAHKRNDNDETAALLGVIDRRLRHRGAKPATVLIVCHTGHANQDRASGAYALGADTDAEYVTSLKNGTVCVTRSRFKDCPSLLPLYFRPKTRTLNYKDPEGKPVTSVVLVPVAEPAKQLRSLTPQQRETLDVVAALCETDGKPVSLDRIQDGKLGELKTDTLKDRLRALTDRGALMCCEGLYSIPAPIVSGYAEEFDT